MSSVHYQIHSDDDSKPWLILIHGLFGSLDNLSGLRKHFSPHYQILSVDLPDHGLSSHTEKFSFDNYANLIVNVITRLNIETVTLVGHSLGGKVAMQIALNHAPLVSHLVVLDIAPVKYSARHTQVFDGLNSVTLNALSARKDADQALAKYIQVLSTRQFLLKSLYQTNQQWSWRFNLELLQRDYAELSGAITCATPFMGPVLFLKGELSDYLLPTHKAKVVALFPNSQSKMISKTGHWLHAEKPELCAKVILSFLQK